MWHTSLAAIDSHSKIKQNQQFSHIYSNIIKSKRTIYFQKIGKILNIHMLSLEMTP